VGNCSRKSVAHLTTLKKKINNKMKFPEKVNGNERGFSSIELIMVSNITGNVNIL